MWVATRLVRFRGRVYRKGERVPAENSAHRRAFVTTGRIVWRDDSESESAPQPEPIDLRVMKRDELNAHAAAQGIESPEKYRTKDDLIAAIEGGTVANDDEGDEGIPIAGEGDDDGTGTGDVTDAEVDDGSEDDMEGRSL